MESVQLTDAYIRSLLSQIKFMKKDNMNLVFEVGNQRFNIVIPSDSDGSYFIELPITLSGYEWLSRVNEFSFSKKPTIDRLIKYIERKYEENRKTTNVNIMDVPDISINQTDLQEQRYRRELEKKISTCKSILNVNTDANKAPVLFSGKTPGILILNSFFDLRKKNVEKSTEITLTNDNIYQWNVKMRNFKNKDLNNELGELQKKYGYNCIEFEVHFHDKLYPGYPPFVRMVRPRLNNSLMHRITNMKMFQFEYWSPVRGMDVILNKLRLAFEEHGSVDYNSEMNDVTKYSSGAYHSLESILIKLASLCDVKDDYEPLDKEVYEKIFKVTKSEPSKQPETKYKQHQQEPRSVVWKAGTGYGTGGSSDWNQSEYIRLQQEKDVQIQSVLNTIIDNVQSYPDSEMPVVYKTLGDSYIIPFIKSYLRGTNMLEMGKHINMYNQLFTFMQFLSTEESIFLFNDRTSDTSLYDLLKILYNEAKQVINMTKSLKDDNDEGGDNDICLMVCTLFEMIDPIVKQYNESRKKDEEEKLKKMSQKMEASKSTTNPVHKKYQEVMEELKFDTVKFTGDFYHKIGTSNTNKNMMKRLAREYASLMSSLPIFFGSSVFVRVDENDSRRAKVLITGPENTPYDSGCLIFDLYTGDDYPNNNPKMQFRNHGGKRFNPNLYQCGKVCLSLLGTWGGNQWVPQTSTLHQLFVSVQSQILVDEPYYNEPGYESTYNTPQGKETSRQYNNERRWYTLCHAMNDLLQNPKSYPEFEDVIKNHFKLKKDYIIALCDKWVAEPNNTFSAQTKDMVDKVKANLNKLN